MVRVVVMRLSVTMFVISTAEGGTVQASGMVSPAGSIGDFWLGVNVRAGLSVDIPFSLLGKDSLVFTGYILMFFF